MAVQHNPKLEEMIVAEVTFYDGNGDAKHFLLSNQDKIYEPLGLVQWLLPFREPHNLGDLFTEDPELVSYILEYSWVSYADGEEIENKHFPEVD